MTKLGFLFNFDLRNNLDFISKMFLLHGKEKLQGVGVLEL